MVDELTIQNVCKAVTPLPTTLVEAIVYFAVPENCIRYLAAKRWPGGDVACPTCGNTHVRFDRKRRVFECNTRHPKRQFSIKVGTIFEDSPLGLNKWLPCVWMIANMKNGVSSHEIKRSLGVTQKTAWFMLHRVRLAMHDPETGKLHGTVEADETWIGGKARNMHADKRERFELGQRGPVGKTAVIGIMQRDEETGMSRVRLRVPRGLRKAAVEAVITENVADGSTLNTDAFKSYSGLGWSYQHNVVDHAVAYVRGTVHTNTLENFWALLKRGIHGTYVSVEPFHLFRYLDEQTFRFNNRKFMTDGDRFALAIYGIVGKRLTFTELTGYARAAKFNEEN